MILIAGHSYTECYRCFSAISWFQRFSSRSLGRTNPTHFVVLEPPPPGLVGHRPGRDVEDRLPHGCEAQRGGARTARDVARVPDGQRELRQQRVLHGGDEPRSAETRAPGNDGR